MRRILFIDDEPRVLEGLQRMLRSMRSEWDLAFVEGGAAAMEILNSQHFDVVVCDMRMPGMDGAQVLSAVRSRHPQTVRIVLSGHSDQEMIMKSVGAAHQYLSKPCDAETLKETIRRACTLRDLLQNEALQVLVSEMTTLPSLPTLYSELVKELESPNASMKRIGAVISQDPGMTAKILQVVNSAFFGLSRNVSNPTDAASLLGVDIIRSLVLSIQVFSQFEHARVSGLSLDAVWRRSLVIGKVARTLAKEETRNQLIAEEAFSAGLLHEAGKLVLAAGLPGKYREMLNAANDSNRSELEAERLTFGATHTEVGGYLLGLWGLPDAIIEAVAYHDSPSRCVGQTFSPLTAVHVAKCLQSRNSVIKENVEEVLLDLDYLHRLGLEDRIPVWEQLDVDSTVA